MALLDISPPLHPGLAVWPGDVPFERVVAPDDGSGVALSSIRSTLHAGAHVDAPSHFVEGAGDITSRALHFYLGPCVVIRVAVSRGEVIRPAHFEGKRILATRVLLRTDTHLDKGRIDDSFASISCEAVEWLQRMGVITIGIDTPSVDAFTSTAFEAHRACARLGVANIEGLDLSAVPEGRYELIALPLRIEGAEASPVRAVLRTLME